MSVIYTATYKYHPEHLQDVHIAFFTNVTNSSQLRASIVRAATLDGVEGETAREAVNYAFINARLITSVLHLRTAIAQAVLASVQGKLRTKTVHSEILWALNPSHNISDAIRRYGVSDSTTCLLAVRVGAPTGASVKDHMKVAVTGDLTPLENLPRYTDWSSVKKYHKLNEEAAVKAASRDEETEHTLVDNFVVSAVAMKSVMQ